MISFVLYSTLHRREAIDCMIEDSADFRVLRVFCDELTKHVVSALLECGKGHAQCSGQAQQRAFCDRERSLSRLTRLDSSIDIVDIMSSTVE